MSVKPSEFLRGCLLLALHETPGAHGYELQRKIRHLVRIDDSARIYRTLRSMEEDGLVVSVRAKSNHGPDRRNYVVTEKGQKRLHEIANQVAVNTVYFNRFIGESNKFIQEQT